MALYNNQSAMPKPTESVSGKSAVPPRTKNTFYNTISENILSLQKMNGLFTALSVGSQLYNILNKEVDIHKVNSDYTSLQKKVDELTQSKNVLEGRLNALEGRWAEDDVKIQNIDQGLAEVKRLMELHEIRDFQDASE